MICREAHRPFSANNYVGFLSAKGGRWLSKGASGGMPRFPRRSGRSFHDQIFDQIGVGQWLRILTAVVEIVGAFALVFPVRLQSGGLSLGFTMVCAVATCVFALHSSPVLPAAVLLALNALIVYPRRDQFVALVRLAIRR